MKIKPKKEQLDFLNWEVGVFFHYGIRTYFEGHKDWDMQNMSLDKFNPNALDINEWIYQMKQIGVNYAIFVTKHHDGFANWPSKFTEYSVANTSFKDGKGDLVQEFIDACHKNDMKIGLYYSPADFTLHNIQRTPKEYDDYFINQVSELLVNYGKIDYLWFDGNGSGGVKYDQDRIIKAIRDLQKDMLIFNLWDPDTRWVLNEEGFAPKECFNVTNVVENQVFDEERFAPAECDTMIRDTWFYSDRNENKLRSLDELVDLYYRSVGHGANFLLNIAPDRSGLLPFADVHRFKELMTEIDRRFRKEVATIDVNHSNGIHSLKFERPTRLNHAVIMENLIDGEAILKYKLVGKNVKDEEIILYEGTSLGHKRICQFNSIELKSITLKILETNGNYKLDNIKLYNIIY